MQPSQESKLASSKSRQWEIKQAQEQALAIWNASNGNERDTGQPDFFSCGIEEFTLPPNPRWSTH